jgi:hexosaminidase
VLDDGPSVATAVGQLPFNFQIGAYRDAIRFDPPRTAAGELEVRIDDCTAVPALVLPLAKAQPRDTPTVLPQARLPQMPGRHDLCFRFTQAHLDPFWVLDWVQVSR